MSAADETPSFASLERQRLDAAEVRAADIRRRHADFSHTFRSDSGTRVLDDLMDFTGYNKEMFQPDALQNAYWLGRRSVFLHIAGILEMSLDELMVLSAQIRRRRIASGP